jgi:hypothetical protein
MAAQLRPDIDAALAGRLGIDLTRPLTVREFGNLLSNRRTDGVEIDGRKRHSAHRSVADTFGLDAKALPGVAQVENVLAGRRADGAAPVGADGKPLRASVVASSLRQFKTAIGVAAGAEATPDDIARVGTDRFDTHEYYKRINATAPPVGYVDIAFGVEKGFSIAYALAPTEGEAALIRSLVERASATGMGYLEQRLGWARTGAGGTGEPERAKMGWVSVEHFNSRPAVDIVRYDAKGEAFTDTREVPGGGIADPHVHRHNVVFSSMLTESGRVASVNLDLLDGEVKTTGAVSSAALATFAREHGMDVVLGPHGEARLASIPDWLRDFYSRRTTQGTDAARDYAREQGKDWDKLSDDERISLIKGGATATRQDKQHREGDEEGADRAVWRGEAEQAGYRHRSVLRPDHAEPKLTEEQRIEVARMAALPLIDAAFEKRAVISLNDLREIAGRGLVVSGLGADAAADVAAVVTALRSNKIRVGGEATQLVFGTELDARGRERTVVTNDRTIADERELLGRVGAAAADRSRALTPAEIDRAAEGFLAAHPKIDRNGRQWTSQLAMAHAIGEGGRTSLSIGVAGSGKTSSVVAVLTDAWHARGLTVYGMTVPWRATQPLQDAGVDQAVAIDAFLKRVADGKITVDRNTVIVADEVSMISVRQQLGLLRLADRTGAQLVEIGDPRQCGSCETPSIELMAKAIGDQAIPKLLTTIRQATQRDREVATMFRDGRAVEGVKAMLQDDRLHLVAGGDKATIADTVARWRAKTDANAADPDYALHVITGTNARALDIGKAIREDRRAHGELGPDAVTVPARDPNGKATYELPIAVGDRLRVFTRTFDADVPRRGRALASNGDVLEVRAVLPDGLRVRNQDGREGRVEWKGLKPWRAPKNEPVMLTYGYAATIDATQALTKTDVLASFPDGTGGVDLRKGYTALSRHTRSVEMIVSDAAERRAIVARQRISPPGQIVAPSREDVIRNVAANLGRFEEKRHATDMLEKAISIQRGVVGSLHRGADAAERSAQRPGVGEYQRSRLADVARHVIATAERAMRQVQDQAQDLLARTLAEGRSHTSRQEPTREHRRGPRLGR